MALTKTELNEKWKKALTLLAEKLDNTRVDNFFQPLKPVKISEREAKIYLMASLNAEFYKGRVEAYYNDITAAVEESFGKFYDVEIVDTEPAEDSSENNPLLDDDRRPNPGYTFESFVSGPNNQLALAACVAVADGYYKNYNPLFLYGGSGLGKTHLMHAIWQYVIHNKPKKKVLYVSSETFTIELVNAIQTKTQKQFRDKYRKVDYLLFDDVQFIQGKESTIDELFHTFDDLHAAGKQVIFSSDRAPKDLGDIPDRLLSRFSWGMVADIQPPDYETRMAILKNKAVLSDIELTPEVMGALDVIAQSIQSNIRELEGALTLISSSAKLTGCDISKEYALKILSSNFGVKQKEITPALIKKAVASYFGIKVSELESSKRSRNIAYPRHIAIYLIREYANGEYSFPKIGEFFGGRDHTTILHSWELISSEIESNGEIKKSIEEILSSLQI